MLKFSQSEYGSYDEIRVRYQPVLLTKDAGTGLMLASDLSPSDTIAH